MILSDKIDVVGKACRWVFKLNIVAIVVLMWKIGKHFPFSLSVSKKNWAIVIARLSSLCKNFNLAKKYLIYQYQTWNTCPSWQIAFARQGT